MKLFDALLKKAALETVVLVDIGAESIAAALARYSERDLPVLLYTRRLPIEAREGEAREAAMLRALEILGNALITEGAPVLARTAGSGTIDTVLVAIDAPWQETVVRTENVERTTPFAFTKSLVATVLERTRALPPGKHIGNESIIGTILNGYETRRPYGRRVHRASITILTSYIDEKIAHSIIGVFERLYHRKQILHIAKCSLRYQAMRAAFPHEPDALILDVSSAAVSVVLVRRGFFVAVSEVPRTKGDAWVAAVTTEFAELAKKYPLPRAIFLLAPEADIKALRTALDAANLGSLWLSDNPPKIVSVLASHIMGGVQLKSDASSDLSLLLMALYYHQASKKGEKF